MALRREKCNICYYFEKDDDKKEDSHGNCRRYPPQTVIVGNITEDTDPVKVKLIHNRTHSSFWCGEFITPEEMTLKQAGQILGS
jgi:hypothetical protein